MAVRAEGFNSVIRSISGSLSERLRSRVTTSTQTLEETSISPLIQQKIQKAALRQFALTAHPEHIYSTRKDGGFSLLSPREVNAYLARAELKYSHYLLELASTTDSHRQEELTNLAEKHRKRAITLWAVNMRSQNKAPRSEFQAA
jgi:hypothetical protein